MKILLILAMISLLPSCGKRMEDECRSRESMVVNCQATNAPNYGNQYAREMCNRQYSSDRCY